MSLKQYKNSADIISSKASIEGFRWSPEDYSLLITQKSNAYEDPADQTIDYAVEMHVYTPNGDWLAGDHRIESAKIPEIVARRQFLQLDLQKELEEVGIERGSYKVVFNFIKNLLGNTENRSIFIKEISPNRKEVWLTLADALSTEIVPDDDIRVTLGRQYNQFKRYTNAKYNKGCNNLVLNLGSNNIFKVVNARIGGVTSNEEIGESRLGKGQNIYLKLYDALPTDIVEKQRAWIAQEDKRPYIENVNVYPEVEKEKFNLIQGPNFEIDHDYAMKTETDFQSWNELLDTTTGTTQQIVDRYFSGSLSGINLNVDYSKFDNFVKYSSAEERLKNFRYKIQLVEYYDEQLGILSVAEGSDSGSLKGNEAINTKRKNEVIGGFDAFERWAYNEPTASLFTHGVTGSTLYAEDYAISPYPKYLQDGNYIVHHSTSSYGKAWLDGFISSGSLYDLENEDSLINTIPESIQRDENNDQYVLFVNMIGHHYDILYSYISELTQLHRTEEHPKLGVPGELLYDVAKSMGWQLANGNQAEALWNYKLGKTVSGSLQSSGSMSSKSSEDISHEIWRRIVNNLPYILKTKGTKRSVHALMNTYGIPKTLLSIREYGGPKAEEQVPDLIEDRFSYALQFQSSSIDGTKSPHIMYGISNYTTDKDGWGFVRNGLDSGDEIPSQTREFRFKPAITQSMLLLTSGIENTPDGADSRVRAQIAIQHTGSYSGSGKYGRVVISHGKGLGTFSPITGSTDWLPLYDGEFWNLRWYWQYNGSGSVKYNESDNTNTTYHIECQRAADYITGKIVHSGSFSYTPTSVGHKAGWGVAANPKGKIRMMIGGYPGTGGSKDQFKVNTNLRRFIEDDNSISFSNSVTPNLLMFTGSMQEYREWIEDIGRPAFDEHTLNPTSYVSGFSETSSFDTLVRHYPLGTDTIAINHADVKYQILSSSHPAQNILDAQLPYHTSADEDLVVSGSSFATMSFFPNETGQRGNYQRLTETYYVQAPSIGGTNTNSTKIRIEDQKLVGTLDPRTSAERSRYDYATLDSNRLGLFYSAADQINKDIYNNFGGISLDDYFGDPADEFNITYPDLNKIAHEYWKKYDNRNDINAYIKIFSLFDFSLFTQIKQLIPVRANSAMGLLIEPHVLERSKVQLMEQPKITNPQYEQRITLSTAAIEGARLDYTASLHDPRSITSSTLPLNALLGIERSITSSTLPINASIENPGLQITSSVFKPINTGSLQVSDIKLAEPDISSSTILISHVGTDVSDNTYRRSINVSYSSSIVPSDYRLSSWHHKKTINGITYSGSERSLEGPVIVSDYGLGTVVGSNQTEVDYDRGMTASAAIQAVILEQRKSYTYKKKVEFYTPKDLALRHYPLDAFDSSGTMRDNTLNYQHSLAYIKTEEDGDTETALDPANARFESVTHNNFTGQMLIFDCYQPQSDSSRGSNRISIPEIGRARAGTGTENNTDPWSMSFLLNPASGSLNNSTWIIGNDTTRPAFGIDQNNNPFLRSEPTADFWYPRIYPNENTFWDGYTSTYDFDDSLARESLMHVAITYNSFKTGSTGDLMGRAQFFINGKKVGEQRKDISDSNLSGSFYFKEIGAGYQSSNNTHGYSGSLGQFRFYHHVLSDEEVNYLNRYPHLRANRDSNGKEIFTRRYGGVAAREKQFWVPGKGIKTKNTLFAPFVNVGLPTSHSLEPADYMDDEFTGITRKCFEGSKLTGPDWNINTTATTDGGPVVSFTITNPNTLTSKEGNLKVQ